MREERLLERIRRREREPWRRERQEPKQVVDSILAHLHHILNTRRGNVVIAEDYGVPDFTEFLSHYPDSLREFERAIRQTISRYEPRLGAVRVSFVPREDDRFVVRFQISARLAVDSSREPVLFESILDSDGKIRLKG
ncbi:MAG TPA: type VI secretion system baseplate subunit TssE [Desulfobulbus sp.]|nr:type VI secretion system baseplate subunit TssE [Desulfobulbus sp.]